MSVIVAGTKFLLVGEASKREGLTMKLTILALVLASVSWSTTAKASIKPPKAADAVVVTQADDDDDDKKKRRGS